MTKENIPKDYKTYFDFMHEMAYRNNFTFHLEIGNVDIIWKIEGENKTEIVTSEEFPRNELWFYAWKKLKEEYGEEFAFGKPVNRRKKKDNLL